MPAAEALAARRGGAVAEPVGEQRLCPLALRVAPLVRLDDDLRGGFAGGERSGAVHDQHGVAAVVGENGIERVAVARRAGVADDVDGIGLRPGRRKHAVERLPRRRRQLGEASPEIGQRVGRQHPGAAAIGEDRQTLARERRRLGQDLGGVEQLAQLFDAQEPGAAENGVVGGIRARQRSRMRHGGPGGRSVAPCLQHNHRLRAGGAAGGRQELRRLRQLLHVEQDRAALCIAGEIVEQVAEIDVRHVAQGDDVREADAARARPIDDGGDERARLRQEGEVALERHAMAEAGVEPDLGQDEAEAIRALDAQAGGLRRLQHPGAQLPAHPGGDHNRRTRPLGGELCDQPGNRGRRGRDHAEVGHTGKSGNRRITGRTVDGGVVRIDEPYGPGKSARGEIGRHDRPDARRLGARADEGHRLRRQQLVKVAYGHDWPASWS